MSAPRYLLLTISRTWTDIPVRLGVLSLALDQLYRDHPGAVLLHGACPKGDEEGAAIWRQLGGTDEPMPANWDVWGDVAGPLRNQDMVNLRPFGYASFIHNTSPGATGCRKLARKASVPELVHVAWDDRGVKR
jgi:hypothetical protein